MKVTIRDVARQSKVSRTTVSRVMHNHQNVSPESRKKVLQTINRLKYDPLKNIPFVQKSKKLSRTIGLVSPTSLLEETGFFLNQAIIAFHNAVQDKGYRPVLYNDYTLYRQVEQGFHEWHKTMPADGFIFFCPRSQWDPAVRKLSSWNVPVVLVRRETAVAGIPVVTNDHAAGVRLALEHFAALGHQRIGLAGRRVFTDSELPEQGAAYRAFLREKGLPAPADLVFDFHQKSGADFQHWLKDHSRRGNARFTALLCLDDMIAVDAIRAVHSLGRSVPQDLAVIGYDNTVIARLYNPGITSVNMPVPEMIECAAGLLEGLWGKVKPSCLRYEFKSELVVRESCGSPMRLDDRS